MAPALMQGAQQNGGRRLIRGASVCLPELGLLPCPAPLRKKGRRRRRALSHRMGRMHRLGQEDLNKIPYLYCIFCRNRR